MERYKENLELRKDQNIVSSVLLICFLIVALAFGGILASLDTPKGEDQGTQSSFSIR